MHNDILKKYWGYDQFRAPQEEIIHAVLNGKDTLALMPTGGGKSVCYQVPALMKPGLCLVISPLIALIKDQELELLDRGIRATSIISGMRNHEIETALDNCEFGNYKFLYVSPERLQNEFFRERLKNIRVSLIAVDEAHCVSQWGYDFRPPYLQIADIRTYFPEAPVLALTASATPEVQEDIVAKLGMKEAAVFKKSFARDNISYLVRHAEDKFSHLLKILNHVQGCGIVYVRNRRKTKEIADFLIQNGIPAGYYHAGLDYKTRQERQELWMKGICRIIVATNAFGMGINKPNVRTVIHMDLPDDLESYYQEAGRAGRDGNPSYAVVLYNNADINNLRNKIIRNFPEEKEVRNIYNTLYNYLQIPVGSGSGVNTEFDIAEFSHQYKADAVQALNCLNILALEGILEMNEFVYLPSRFMITMPQHELYEFQVRYQEYEPLIKLLLRNYAGLFEQFVRINEKDLARKGNTTEKEVIAQLKKLHQFGVLNYIPASDKPRLSLLCDREKQDQFYISRDSLLNRKNRFEVRANYMINFVTNHHQCRSMILLNYFGENNIYPCKRCDYCRESNKKELLADEFKELSCKIITVLSDGKKLPVSLSKLLPDVSESKVQEVITFLLDQDEITFDEAGYLQLPQHA